MNSTGYITHTQDTHTIHTQYAHNMHTILHTQYTDTTNIYAAHTPQQYRTQIQQSCSTQNRIQNTQNITTPVQHREHNTGATENSTPVQQRTQHRQFEYI